MHIVVQNSFHRPIDLRIKYQYAIFKKLRSTKYVMYKFIHRQIPQCESKYDNVYFEKYIMDIVSTILGVHLFSVGGSYMLGLCSLSGRTSYRQISWSLEAARLGVIIIVSLWNLTGISTELLPKSRSNFRVTRKIHTRISRLQCFARSCVNTSICLVNRGTGVVTIFGLVSENYTQFETWCFYV